MTAALQETIQALPRAPGVYLFKNQYGNVLYVGKAKVLANRVRSYFQAHTDLSVAKQLMVRQITTIAHIPVRTESDALTLEDQLIKDYQPRYNILAKDDKSLLYIHITDETFPRVLAARHPEPNQPGMFYGPYPFARNLRQVLQLLLAAFPHRTCRILPKRACLEYYIGNCPAPCIGKISQADYMITIDQIVRFFEGHPGDLAKQLQQQMQQAAQEQKFEYAARLRNQIQALRTLTAIKRTPQQYLREQLQNKAINPDLGLTQLQQALGLPQPPHRVEVYDISHHQGKFTVGSMIVFIDGIPDTSEYRRFRIRTVSFVDDFKSLNEVVTRRLKRDWPLPDLAIMDGGKGQLQAVAALWELAHVPVVALAKKREEIFFPHQSIPLNLPEGSQGLFLVQRMRDEAHRFAIQYYRLLHKKTMRENAK